MHRSPCRPKQSAGLTGGVGGRRPPEGVLYCSPCRPKQSADVTGGAGGRRSPEGSLFPFPQKPMQMAIIPFPLCKQFPRWLRPEWLSSAILSKKTDRFSRKIQRFALVKGRSNALRWLWVIEFFELIDEGGFVVIADMNIDVLLVLCEVLDLSRECTFDDTVE